MSLAGVITTHTNMLKQFLRFSESYFRRHNHLGDASAAFVAGIKNFLTLNKKLKIARYRVNHLNYRLHQMETLIEQGNPNNLKSGKTLNYLR